MATIREIIDDPSTYLGAEAEACDAVIFCAAARALMTDQGLSEQDATDVVWNNGDWWGRAHEILGTDNPDA